MALDLRNGYHDLTGHIGHEIVVARYGADEPVNVAIECETCGTVLLEFDKPTTEEATC